MDQATGRIIVVAVALIVVGIFLRRRYGNVYKHMTEAVERVTGLEMSTIWRGLGIATLAVWALVYLLYGADQDSGLDQLFHGLFQSPSGAPAPE